MKPFTFKFQLAILLFSLTLPQLLIAQYYTNNHFTRGADTAEIYLSCQWYMDQNNIPWNGIFHSIDNGETLSIQRKTNWYVECGSIYGDSMPGALFQIPFHSADTMGVSFDYGKTFETKYFHIVSNSIAGCMAGETYTKSWGFYHGTGYGANFSFQSENDSLRLQDVGTLPGEFYCIKTPGGNNNPIKLAYSNDYGQTFSIKEVFFPGMPPLIDECNIHRGTEPGELYFVVWETYYTIALFHSTDYGQTVTFQSFLPFTKNEFWSTPGKTPGSYYYAQTDVCWDHSCLWISFSRDYGVTFATYYHDLDSTFTSISHKEILPDLSVFPNPANDHITLRLDGRPAGEDFQIVVYDFFGQPVLDGILRQGQSEVVFDTRNISAGLYYYRITSGNNSASLVTNDGVCVRTLSGKIVIVR
jgi:hypothetical protein